MASPLTDRQWLLFLTLLPDVGRRTLRHVLERQQVRRETPAEILRLPDETLREEYRLPPRALRALREERAARLEETARLDAHLTRCGGALASTSLPVLMQHGYLDIDGELLPNFTETATVVAQCRWRHRKPTPSPRIFRPSMSRACAKAEPVTRNGCACRICNYPKR